MATAVYPRRNRVKHRRMGPEGTPAGGYNEPGPILKSSRVNWRRPSWLPLPNPLDEVLGGTGARLCGTFDEALEIVEAVRVLARERQISRRLAEPALHRGEVARLVAGVAPERVRVGWPVRARKERAVEERHSRGGRPREDRVAVAEETCPVGIDVGEVPPTLAETVVDHHGLGPVGTGRRRL